MPDEKKAPRFKGKRIELGGKTYVVPALGLGALKGGLFDRLRTARLAGDTPPLELVFEVVLAALQRNYPEFVMEDLEDLDAGEITTVVEAFTLIIAQSGFGSKAPGSAAEGNSAPGPVALSPSTGD